MQSALVRLVVLQFAVYMVLASVAFFAWALAFSDSLSVLEVVFGRYLKCEEKGLTLALDPFLLRLQPTSSLLKT